jgi:hypothetical protein
MDTLLRFKFTNVEFSTSTTEPKPVPTNIGLDNVSDGFEQVNDTPCILTCEPF